MLMVDGGVNLVTQSCFPQVFVLGKQRKLTRRFSARIAREKQGSPVLFNLERDTRKRRTYAAENN